MPVFAYILLCVAVLILLSGFLVFYIACVRRKEIQWLLEDEVKKTPYGRHFNNIRTGDHFLSEHNAQDIWIKSYDNLRLYGVYVPAEKPIGTIILAHGYRSNKLVDFGIVFELYHNMGMNLLVIDQRSHGMSEGRFITFGVKESRDIQSWITYHNAHFGTCPVFLSGLSMGASTMLYLADTDLPKNVRGIIADCGFTSAKQIISHVYRRVIHLPAAPSIWMAELFARIIAGFSLYEKDTRKSLENSKVPVFLIHGTADNFVPCEMTRQAYASCTGKKEMLLVEGADHGVSFLLEPARYTQMVNDFITENLEGNA